MIAARDLRAWSGGEGRACGPAADDADGAQEFHPVGVDVGFGGRAVKSARTAEPGLAEDDLLALVAENTGLPVRLIRAAVGYWASYAEEIDAEIAAAEAAEESAEDAWRRERRLLAG